MTRDHEDNLERRAADTQLWKELTSEGFTGPKYHLFRDELARYGISVLRAWMCTGRIFQLTAARGLALHPTEEELEELHRKPEIRDDLAMMTVAVALPRFRDDALAEGGWRADGGASLTTYFMGKCLSVFPNEFREHRVQQRKWQRQDGCDPTGTAQPTTAVTDPSAEIVGNMRVCADLARADIREASIVALTIDGYSQEEIVEILRETSIRAVEGVMRRWRRKEQRRAREEGA